MKVQKSSTKNVYWAYFVEDSRFLKTHKFLCSLLSGGFKSNPLLLSLSSHLTREVRIGPNLLWKHSFLVLLVFVFLLCYIAILIGQTLLCLFGIFLFVLLFCYIGHLLDIAIFLYWQWYIGILLNWYWHIGIFEKVRASLYWRIDTRVWLKW